MTKTNRHYEEFTNCNNIIDKILPFESISMIICCRKVLSSVKPGYLRPLLPTEAPNDPENWKDVMTDVEKLIMPGVIQ